MIREAAGARGTPAGHDRISPQLRRLIDGWPGNPAFILGPALDVLEHNALAAPLHSGFQRFDNLARMVFLDPAGHAFYQDRDTTGSPKSSARSAPRAPSTPSCGRGTR